MRIVDWLCIQPHLQPSRVPRTSLLWFVRIPMYPNYHRKYFSGAPQDESTAKSISNSAIRISGARCLNWEMDTKNLSDRFQIFSPLKLVVFFQSILAEYCYRLSFKSCFSSKFDRFSLTPSSVARRGGWATSPTRVVRSTPQFFLPSS